MALRDEVSNMQFDLMAEKAHKQFSALRRPRKASVLFGFGERAQLEAQGLSPGEIGTLRRTRAFYAQ
jgi:hypothetical protein